MSYVKKQYIQSAAVTQAQKDYQQKKAEKPSDYQSQYQPQLDALLGKLQSREPFSYAPGTDALYRQYRDQYIRQGKLAMEDTLAKASALTGGYGNSYAQTAGQQTYQGYLQALNDRLPELYALAMERYKLEGDALQNQYSILSQQEDRDYSRYQSALSQWNAEQQRLYESYVTEREFDYGKYADGEAFAYGQYRDGIADKQWQANFDYRQSQDKLAYDQWLQEFQYQQSQDKLQYEQWLKEFAEDQRRYDLEWAAKEAAAAAKTSRGGKSSGGGENTQVDTGKAQQFVERMLNGATSSKFNPQRVISGTNALTEEEKQEAQAYLKQVLANGRMK